MLNMKQEKYVQNLIKGMSQREAYKDAYAAKYQDKAIDNKASKLFNKGEVQARYQELLDKAKDKAIMKAIDRKVWLTKVLNGEITEKQAVYTDGDVIVKKVDADLSTKMKAMDILNKMDGEYIDRLKVSNDEDKPFEVNIKVVK